MGRQATQAPGPFARAIAAEVRAAMAREVPMISASDLARGTGLSQNYISKRLRNELPFNLNDLDAICEILRVPLKDLIARAEVAAAEYKSKA